MSADLPSYLFEPQPEILRERREDDPNVVDTVIHALMDAGYPDPTTWTSDPDVMACLAKPPLHQRFDINRYWRWRLVLVTNPEHQDSARHARSYLDDDPALTHAAYEEIWRRILAPTITRLGI